MEVIKHIKSAVENREISSLVEESLTRLPGTGAALSQADDSDQAHGWLSWARSHPMLKVVTAPVPHGVLPNGLTALLHDVRVSSRGPDDQVFDNNADIRQKVARGNCFLEIEGSTKDSGASCVIYALKKFTGGLGDDDDRVSGNDHTWQRYFLKPLTAAHSVIATQKANGEAAHLSARKICGKYILFGGSKNVHMAFKNKEDIKRYGNEQRYSVAGEVNDAIMDLVNSMRDDEREKMLEFLSLTGLTAIFEILNPAHQHVEELSHLKSPLLQFITWTSNRLDPPAIQSLCCMPPHVSIEIARVLKLPTVDFSVIDIKDVDDQMLKVRQGYGYEGEVLYFLDENHSVIGLLKKKTIWYIVCRAIREKVRAAARAKTRRSDFKLHVVARKIESRIGEIQTWLGLDDQTTAKWKVLGTDFLGWCMKGLDHSNLKTEDIADQFPVTWRRFLEDTGNTDRILPEAT